MSLLGVNREFKPAESDACEDQGLDSEAQSHYLTAKEIAEASLPIHLFRDQAERSRKRVPGNAAAAVVEETEVPAEAPSISRSHVIFIWRTLMSSILGAYCGQPFEPRPQVSGQAYCSSPYCQRARKRLWQRAKLQSDADYRINQRAAQQAWVATKLRILARLS